jgi:transaldolase
MQQAFGTQLSAARSQPHYLDVTHPDANKGVVIERLARYLNLPVERIAAVGDQPNDVLMFEKSGLSVAMGNADDDVKARATAVTSSFADEGFANAIEEIILPQAEAVDAAAIRPTGRLHRLGQSLWLDASAHIVDDGALSRAVHELSITGLVAREGVGDDDVLDELKRIGHVLRPAFDASVGIDGWVSVEASPLFTLDGGNWTGAVAAMRAWVAQVAPNVMLRVPAIPALLPAIEEAVFMGVAVDATLVFSREQYLAAAEAFLRGIERRMAAGLRPDIVSIASLDVAGWNDVVMGLAMAQRTYRAFRSLLHSPRWQRAYNGGARTQRLRFLTASEQNVEALTAQFTIVTLSELTLAEFAQHGEITTVLHADDVETERALAAAGVDLYAEATKLQEDAAIKLSWAS